MDIIIQQTLATISSHGFGIISTEDRTYQLTPPNQPQAPPILTLKFTSHNIRLQAPIAIIECLNYSDPDCQATLTAILHKVNKHVLDQAGVEE